MFKIVFFLLFFFLSALIRSDLQFFFLSVWLSMVSRLENYRRQMVLPM